MGNFSEARALSSAYLILATGDHDYKGQRVKAMHQIEAAGKLLGMDLRGDARGRQPQALSDGKLREARGLLETVLGAAEVRSQPRISKHITEFFLQSWRNRFAPTFLLSGPKSAVVQGDATR
jgi:hypothetical protein